MESSLGLVDARIWTADRRRPWANSLRIDDGVIKAVDDDDAAQRADRVLSLGGAVILPGLIDTHSHFVMGGESLLQLDLSGVKSRDEFEAAIAQRCDELNAVDRGDESDRAGWIIAHGWNEENWDGTPPDKTWLRPAGDRPCIAWRMDSHVCLVNDAVMRHCDLSHEPEGGRIARDASGALTGLFIEAAAWRLIGPVIPPSSSSAQRDAARAAARHANAHMLTTMGSMEYEQTVRSVLEPLRSQLPIRLRITLLDRDLPLDCSFAESFTNDEHLSVIGYKSFLDGTLGARTARLLDDYEDDPGNAGLWCEHAAEGRLDHWFDSVVNHGFQPAMHAIGDAAAQLAIDTIAHGLDESKRRSIRPRIEHLQQIDRADLGRCANIVASMQPLHRADDGRFALRRVGESRLNGFFRFRDLLDAGAVLAFGSDWPIVSCDPMLGLRAAVTARTTEGRPIAPDQALTVEEALRAYTIDAAYALHFEQQIGSIEPGKYGDLVVLEDDPFTIDWNISLPRPICTIVAGEVVAGTV